MQTVSASKTRSRFALQVARVGLVFLLACGDSSGQSALAFRSLLAQSSNPSGGGESQGEAAPQSLHLSVGNQTANPGNPAVVPLNVNLPNGIELQSLSAEIEWTGTILSFESFQRGIAAEAVGAEVNAKVIVERKNAAGESISVLQVDVSVTTPRRGISEGLLVYLTYQVAKDATPTEIELRPKLVSAESMGTPRQRFTAAAVETGKVFVQEAPSLPPYVNCFFFNH